MKKMIGGVFVLFLLMPQAGAEVIDAVMYNPARLGQYEKLKISDKASFRGGVQANTFTAQSAGTVSVENEGDYQVQYADVKGSAYLPQTAFEAPTVNAKGGTARFVQSGQTSEINTLNSTLPALKANVLKMQGMTVNGTSGADYDGNHIKGLKLGGNDIPAPSMDCRGLGWFARVDQNSGQTYQVLGLQNCGNETSTACMPSTSSWYTVPTGSQPPADTCPGANTASSYNCSGTYEGTCTDVLQATSSTAPADTDQRTELPEGSSATSSSVIFTQDTCNGDYTNAYTCTDADRGDGSTSGRDCVDAVGVTGQRVSFMTGGYSDVDTPCPAGAESCTVPAMLAMREGCPGCWADQIVEGYAVHCTQGQDETSRYLMKYACTVKTGKAYRVHCAAKQSDSSGGNTWTYREVTCCGEGSTGTSTPATSTPSTSTPIS